MTGDHDLPTAAQLAEVRRLRIRDDVPLSNLPRTKEQANAEIAKFHSGTKADFTIWGTGSSRRSRSTQKQYEAQLQQQINETHVRLREEFLARDAERQAKGAGRAAT